MATAAPATSSGFSFKAPFPPASSPSAGPSTPVKQRRVSIALPSSSEPRTGPAWNFRDDTGVTSHVAESEHVAKKGRTSKIVADDDNTGSVTEKKPRKKWSSEETQMLVDGCNKHGVGNWKTILSDPEFHFDTRSPVDLKDRFRTYFPDAYKQHYPNARTHLSTKVRSTLPDGSSLFEKTRLKKRRPFTEEEDHALKAGYEKHGTVWAVIVKDPVFQEHNRRSTDLRDRFRNAYPDLYQAAGYKPRAPPKKKDGLARATADDQLVTGPVRRKRRHTSQGILRGGTKSVPQSAAPSEDEGASSGEEEDVAGLRPRTRSSSIAPKRSSSAMTRPAPVQDSDDLMDSLLSLDPNSSSDMEGHLSSGLDTPTHSSHNAWSVTNGSPTSSHLSSDYLVSNQSSPFQSSRGADGFSSFGTIGKSAWGGDWFSANPRMDPTSGHPSAASLFDHSFSPSSPFSFNHLSHGVLDRYDLVPASIPHDFLSEAGVGETHSTFSDDLMPSRGFTHHSNYAGDLIFGARSYLQQNNYYGDSSLSMGLGLTGMTPATSAISPAMTSIDEFAGITLNDHQSPDQSQAMEGVMDSPSKGCAPPHAESSGSGGFGNFQGAFALDDLVDLSQELHVTPPGTPHQQRSQRHRSAVNLGNQYSMHGRSISVPPNDARGAGGNTSTSMPQRPAHLNTTSQPDLNEHHNFFSLAPPLTARQSMPPPPAQSMMHQQAGFLTPSASYSSLPGGDTYGLSFLDLHYYNNGGGGGWMGNTTDSMEQRQTSHDLPSSSSPASPPMIPKTESAPSVLGFAPASQSGGSTLMRSYSTGRSVRQQSQHAAPSMHQRGQSATVVCPQDLMLSNSNSSGPGDDDLSGSLSLNGMGSGTIGRRHQRASWDGTRMLGSAS